MDILSEGIPATEEDKALISRFYHAGLAWKNGRNVEKDFQWTFPDGTVVKFGGAVINVTNIGAGDSTAVAPLEFEVMSNGKPTVTTGV